MDKATLENQSILWHHRKCGKNPNLDRNIRLCLDCHRKKQLKLERNLYTILQILSVNVFQKTPILQTLSDVECNNEACDNYKQLTLFN